MKRIKNLLLTAAAALCASGLHAQEPGTAIIVESADADEPTVIALTAQTKITFSADGSRMSLLPAEGGETLSFETAKVHRVTFDLEYSSVDNVEAAAGEVTLLNHGGIVTITAPGNFTFGAWDMNGRSICSGSAQGQTALDFTSQPKGVYVIRAAGNTIKFINK